MLMNSPINTIGTISLLAKLAFCLPLHLLRCTTCSFERAHGHHVNMRGLEQTNEAVSDLLRPPAGEIPARTWNHTAKPPHSATSDAAVEPRRLELLTSSLQRRRSTS